MEHHEHPTPHRSPKNNSWMIPVSIIVAGLLIAGALFGAILLTRTNSNTTTAGTKSANAHLEKNMTSVSASDHIRGSADAPIKIVEYSDTDCPYCQLFHPTLTNIFNQYGASGKVAWVYRYFNTHIPAHIHTQSEAEALECVASLNGNDTYWKFLDLLVNKKDFTKNPSVLVDPATLPGIVASLGVDKTKFNQCVTAHSFKSSVDAETLNATASGGHGTPFTIITTKAPVSSNLKKMLAAMNTQFTAQNPGASDVVFASPDGNMVVLNGAIPANLLDQVMSDLVKNN